MKYPILKKSLLVSLLCFGYLVSFASTSKDLPLVELDAVVFPEVASAGMVVTQEARATEVGVKILEQGGNAIDAAVAVGFALAATLPRAGNIGGGGFMLVYDSKEKTVNALDYREKAPKKADRDMFLNILLNVDNERSRYSILSSGVPGTVAGLVAAHKKYGKLPFKQLVEPAVKLAESIPMTFAMSQSLNSRLEALSADPGSKAVFTKKDGNAWRIGEDFKQPKLAQTLKLIAETNGRDFYEGKTADRIVEFFKDKGGLINHEDLKGYNAVWRKPISTQYGDYKIFSMPPPSSGGIHLIQLFNIVRNFPIDKGGANTAYTTHVKTEAMKFAYADRSEYLGDPDFVKVPVDKLTSLEYAKRLATRIQIDKVKPSSEIRPGEFIDKESPQTTHFSIMDKEGNVVSNTYTLNFSYGSRITIPEVGMLLNNQMDDFSAKPGNPNGYGLLGGDANAIQPDKRPLSSMTPVIVLDGDKPWLATGSMGGSRIITIVFNFLLNRMVHNMNIAEATIAPRVHHQWYPDALTVEKGFPLDSAKILKKLGHNIRYRKPWGSSQSLEYKDGLYYGFADPRMQGVLAKGPNTP